MQSHDALEFDWLCTPATENELVLRSWDQNVTMHHYPIPPHIGQAWISKLELFMGMTLFRAQHHFAPEMAGQMFEIADIKGSYPAPSLMIQSVRGGRITHHEFYPQDKIITYSPGHDLFRLSTHLHLKPMVETCASSTMNALLLRLRAVENLLGEETARRTLDRLGLIPGPHVLVAPIPTSISDHLHQALSHTLTGAAQRLHAQARILDYWSALVTCLGTNAETQSALSASQNRARKIRQLLLNTQGRIPALEQLTEQFGRSARTLNNDFIKEYGMSIVDFIAERRLSEAHAAIVSTSIPLKVIAERLGYVHVSHFMRAFRRKFGYPPGSLRKSGSAKATGQTELDPAQSAL